MCLSCINPIKLPVVMSESMGQSSRSVEMAECNKIRSRYPHPVGSASVAAASANVSYEYAAIVLPLVSRTAIQSTVQHDILNKVAHLNLSHC